MTGWTQFTVRFEEERHADALESDVAAAEEQGEFLTTYNETYGNIARVRILAYGQHEVALDLLEAAGDFDTALVADFNDTADSGAITEYTANGGDVHQVNRWSCDEPRRRRFTQKSNGIIESGMRAGSDFDLSEKYDDSPEDQTVSA